MSNDDYEPLTNSPKSKWLYTVNSIRAVTYTNDFAYFATSRILVAIHLPAGSINSYCETHFSTMRHIEVVTLHYVAGPFFIINNESTKYER